MCRSACPGFRHSVAVYDSNRQWSVHRECHRIRHFVWSYVLHHLGMRTVFARTTSNTHTNSFVPQKAGKISVLIVQHPSIGIHRCANSDAFHIIR